jgi:DNA-binding transcriptional regulator YdaS (Cro superfamily)
MNSFAEIIKAKGGPKAVADRLGLRPVTIRAWKSRDWIPRQHWPDIIRAYRDVTLTRLLELEERGAGK